MIFITKNIKNSLWLFCLLCSCTYSPEELILKLNKDESYKATAQSDNCDYTLQWLPKEYLAAMELKDAKKLNSATFSQKMDDYDKSYYFRLSLALKSGDNAMLNGIASVPAYSNKWNFLTYGMTKHFYVLTAQYDTIYPMYYTFQNTYIYGDKLNFLYVFSKERLSAQDKNGFVLKFKDELFAQKTLSFELKDFAGIRDKNYNLTFKD